MKFPVVRFLETVPKFREGKKNSSSCVYILHKTSHQEISRPGRAVTAKNIAQVEMFQRRIVTCVLSRYNRQPSVSDMLDCLGWKTQQSRRTIARLSLLYKFRNNLAYTDNNELPVNFTQLRILLHAHLGMLLS